MSEFDKLVGERKHVTTLFADIVDSTHRIKKLDIEPAAQYLDTGKRCMEQAIAEYGGTVLKRLGDGVIAVFGAPVALEDHAVRACYSALMMQRLVRGLEGQQPSTANDNISIRVGINTGDALVRPDEDGAKGAVDVFGIAIHIAARLQSLAEPGTVCISESTQSAVEGTFECTLLGLKSIKGVDTPIEIYSLDRAREFARPRFGLEHWDIEVPFVGRAREMAVLAEHLQQLVRGEGSILGVRGDAGIGKSRLIAEVHARVTGSLLWLEGSGVSVGRSISYLPFIQIIRRYIGAHENDDSKVLWTRLSVSMRGLFGEEADDVLPYLATFMGLGIEGDLNQRIAYLDSDAMGRQIRRSILLLFQNIARRCPTILVFEDFYWADESSAALIEHLFPLVDSEPLTICIVGRGETDSLDARLLERAAKASPSRFVDILLAPLRAEESVQMFNRLFSAESRLARLRENILANAEGNPLFIEEVVRTLIESKALIRDANEGGWRLNADIEALRIPDTIHDVITARIDRLHEDLKRVLTVASVIGRNFHYAVLHTVSEGIKELDNSLSDLVRREFINECRRDPELEYMFRHAVIQEITYDTVLYARRRQIHRKVAETLETLFPERLDELSGVLAYHFGRAEAWEKAQAYLLKAGGKADRLAADAEALQHYQKAVEACVLAFGNRMDAEQRAAIDRKLGEAYYRRGEHAEAFRYFERALSGTDHARSHRATSIRRALLREVFIQVAHSLRLPVTPASASASASAQDRIDMFNMMAWMVLFDCPERLPLYVLASLNEAERHSHAAGIAFGAGALAYGFDTMGFTGLARHYLAKAARSADQSGSPVAQSGVQLCYGWHQAYAGEWNEAGRHYAEAARLGWEVGDIRSFGSAIFGHALIRCHQGRFEEAWKLTQRQLKTGEESADRVAMRSGTLLKGMVLVRLGRLKESEMALRSSLDLTQSAPDFQLLPHVSAELAQCLIKQGRFDEADAVLDVADGIVRRRGLHGHNVAFLKAAIAESCIARAEHVVGADRARSVKLARRACKAALKSARVFRGARAQVLRLMGTSLWLDGTERAAREHWRESLAAAEALGAPYEQAQTYFTMGRLTKNSTHVEQGNAILGPLISDVSVLLI